MGQERQTRQPQPGGTTSPQTQTPDEQAPDLQPMGNGFMADLLKSGLSGVAQAAAASTTQALVGQAATAQTTPEEGAQLAELRKLTRRPNPEWLAQAQAAIGVPADQCTGAINTATVRALLAFRAKNGLTGKKLLDDPTIEAMRALAPGEPWLELGTNLGRRNETPKKDADTPKDVAAQGMGYASFKAWQGTWGNAKFLGKNVYGHPILQHRVKAADAYIRNRFPGDDEDTIRGKLGWDGVIGGAYDHDAGNSATHVHAMGVALDVSGPKNPWIFPSKNGGTAQAVQNMQDNAARLFGGPGRFNADDTSKWGAELSTDEAYDKMAQANTGFKQYLELGKLKPAELKARLSTLGVADSELNTLAAQVKEHHDWWFGNRYRSTANNGFMDMSLEIVRAFRDAGGLAWGAMDWGNENGDTMHFDARTDPVGKQVYDSGKRAKAT